MSIPDKQVILLFDRHSSIPIKLQNWSRLAGLFTMGVGVLVLVGWWLNQPVLKSVWPSLAPMKPNTAVAFLAAGLALWLMQNQTAQPALVYLRRACAVVGLTLGLLTLGEWVFGWNLGIDQLLVKEPEPVTAGFPGRMVPVTAFNFVLLGAALLLLDVFGRYRLAQFLTLVAGGLAQLAFIGYLYGDSAFYSFAPGNAMAINTATTFMVVCLGILFAKPERGWMVIVASDSTGGALARRLLPAAVMVMMGLGWLQLLGQRVGLYDSIFGVALFTSAAIVILGLLIAWSAASFYNLDLAQRQAADDLRRLNAELDSLVLERTAQLTQANQQLQADLVERGLAEAKFRALLDAAPDASVIVNQQGLIVLVNAQMESLFGYTREALLGKPMDMLMPERFRSQHAGHRHGFFAAPSVRAMRAGLDLIALHEDGAEFPVEISLSPIASPDGPLVAASIRDVTLNKLIEANIREAKELFAKAFDSSPIALAITRSADNVFTNVNESFLTLFDYKRAEVIGCELTDILVNVNPQEQAELAQQLRAQGSIQNREIILRLKPGGICHLLASAERMELNGTSHILTTLVDITKRRQAEAALAQANLEYMELLRQQNIRDPLTDLFNRRYMEESLGHELRRAVRNGRPVVIMMLDVDHFKRINDTYGHEVGDSILRRLGSYLREHSRGSDIACRYGGEEFVLILPEATPEQAYSRAEQLRQEVKSLLIYTKERAINFPSLSFGISAYPLHGRTQDEVLRAADEALYAAKHNGRDQVVVAQGPVADVPVAKAPVAVD